MKMKWTIGKKLYGGFGLVVVIFLIFFAFLLGEMYELKRDIDNYDRITEKIKVSKELQLSVANVWQFITDASLVKEKEVIEEEAKPNLDLALKAIEKLKELNKNEPEHLKKLDVMEKDLEKMWETGNRMFLTYLVDWKKGNIVMDEYDKACDKVIEEVKIIVAELDAEGVEAVKEMHQMIETILLTLFIVIALGLIIGFVVPFFITRGITTPLKSVMETAEKIAEGNLSQKEIVVKSKDEIGQLADIFNKMLRGLNELVMRAELIANGVIGADEVEKELAAGKDFAAAAAAAAAGDRMRGDLTDAFDRMQTELRKLTVQARRIAQDDLNSPILNEKISGELGDAFAAMTSNLKSLAEIAQKIAVGDLTIKIERTGVLADSFGKVIKSSEELSNTAGRIAEGDLTVSIKIRSEKDVLANAFAKMVGNLKSLISKITDSANQITHSSSALSQTTEQAAQTMEQVQNSVQQVAAATSQVAKSSQEISAATQNVSKVVDSGTNNMESLVEKFETVSSVIKETVASSDKLGKRSAEIQEIVGIITKIADQTNLLALNAAIEAARAGEAGRGFAVVADEVRKLAESSNQSAIKIADIVKQVQQETASVSAVSTNALKEAGLVSALASDIKQGYDNIVKSIREIVQQVEQIAATSEETAASAEEITAGSEEQTAAITEIAASSQGLTEQARKLSGETVKFKV